MTTPAPADEALSGEAQPVIFRTSKKRKLYRQRLDDEGPANQPDDRQADAPRATDALEGKTPSERPSHAPTGEEPSLSVAEALRLRNARKSRLKGVGFAAESGGGGVEEDSTNGERSLVLKSEDVGIDEEGGGAGGAMAPLNPLVGGMTRRFAPQTGLVGELVNKHMEEYIESALAKRHSAEKAAATSSTSQQPHAGGQARLLPSAPALPQPVAVPGKPGVPVEGLPTMAGRLMEIDLGEEARQRNVALTERARRKLEGVAFFEEDDPGSSSGNNSGGARGKKPRLGRDGKPFRSRNRRNSDDVARDRAVEALMHENRLDVYEPSSIPVGAVGTQAAGTANAQGQAVGSLASGGATTHEEDLLGAADDRMAEEFRREFLDAMAQRQQRKRTTTANKRKEGEGEVLKGPKLGGSRNTRAAYRDILLQKERDAKK